MSDFDPIDAATAAVTSASEADRVATEREAENDLKSLIAGLPGRRFLRRLLAECGVFRSSFTGDPLTSALREGERNVGLRLLAQVQRVAPERIGELLIEVSDG